MGCRSLEAGTRVRDEIVAETGNSNVTVAKLDLGSLQSVRRFAQEINDGKHIKVDKIKYQQTISMASIIRAIVADVIIALFTVLTGPPIIPCCMLPGQPITMTYSHRPIMSTK
jgi:hypothetical protein